MKKMITILLILIMITSCSSKTQNEELTLLEEEVEYLKVKISDLHTENGLKSKQIENLDNLNSDKDKLIDELGENINKLEEDLLISQESEIIIPVMNSKKYPPESGLVKYIGDVGIRSMPSYGSPLIFTKEEMYSEEKILNCIGVVSAGETMNAANWGVVVLNEYGLMITGYVPYKELELVERPEVVSVESLSGFQLGDRIEKLIGTIDRDYKVISEYLCMYEFPDEDFGSGEPHMQAGNGTRTIDAFVDDEFRVYFLRTNSTKFVLESGYKVGDNAMAVINYYSSRYEKANLEPMESTGDYEYRLSESEVISFSIGEEDLNDDSKIYSIVLH